MPEGMPEGMEMDIDGMGMGDMPDGALCCMPQC